jgi:hypothetical protein
VIGLIFIYQLLKRIEEEIIKSPPLSTELKHEAFHDLTEDVLTTVGAHMSSSSFGVS